MKKINKLYLKIINYNVNSRACVCMQKNILCMMQERFSYNFANIFCIISFTSSRLLMGINRAL